jgi:hypothetical protein
VVVRMGVTQDFNNADYGVGRRGSDVIAAIGDGSWPLFERAAG